MIELGKKQTLYVVKKTPLGIFINENSDDLINSIVLSNQELERAGDEKVYELGDEIEVYCYLDQKKKLQGTLMPPLLCNGEIGVLEAIETNQFGAFLAWGYDKDILMPFSEQLRPIKKGYKVLVGIYEDKSGRLCATQKLKKILRSDSPYKENDQVTGLIYDIKEDMGAFVAVEGKYYGLILSNELLPNMKIGQKVEGRITKVRDDGKLNLTTAQRIDFQMDSDSERLYLRLCDAGGFLPYHDKSDKDVINKAFNMSKGAFKRALGRLYKEEKILIKEDGIYKR
ncbi:RNA-binding protein [Petrocella atlantisensis]|uniref:RNA-binding protein n=1 Tax=Petrocella atlantisensis TaxID=2173034 RepID=A0A3P7NTK8_9FIRM|nr:S1-like domain-containing RNA-binding protein [Petrocella atlantisensis]VDN46544.1 RNA-binding protein [Petrocella atlantisensis]